MAEETKQEPVSMITINPTDGTHGFIFPETATEPEKRLMFLKLEEARLTGRSIEIDSRIKIVPLFKPKEVPAPVVPAAVPEAPKPAEQPKPAEAAPAPVVPAPVPTPAPAAPAQPAPVK
jgi:hypothetical protein